MLTIVSNVSLIKVFIFALTALVKAEGHKLEHILSGNKFHKPSFQLTAKCRYVVELRIAYEGKGTDYKMFDIRRYPFS